MSKLKAITVILILVFSSSVFASEAPPRMQKFNITCPASKLLPVLDTAYHECNNGFANGSCDRFVNTFRRLLPEFDCQRPFDAMPTKNYIVPAIWIASEGAVEDYIRLLYRMTSSKDKMFSDKFFRKATTEAKRLFGSPEFRAVLDGGIAEEYEEKSLRVEKQLKGKKNTN